jgi:hypothetical protein
MTGNMERFLSRSQISIAVAIAAIILVAIAALFLGGAFYLFLVSVSATPPLAALLTGLVGLILAGLIILAGAIASRCRRTGGLRGKATSAKSGIARDINERAADLGSLVARELTAQAQVHPYRALAVSLLAGLAVGGSPELRNMIEKTLNN